MRKMLFVSRHKPTDKQIVLASREGFELVHEGDWNAFDRLAIAEAVVNAQLRGFKAFAVVNPAMALNVAACADFGGMTIGVFENGNRAPEGEKPTFECNALHLWEIWANNRMGVKYA